MPAKFYQRFLQIGLIASLLIVFLVFKDLLFPYITSKQLTFNILTEVLFAIWLVFIWRYREYRPRLSLIFWGLAAYFIAILVSCFVSVDFNLSFWGDAERMLGFFHLSHFFLFYLMLTSVFRSWRDWQALFIVSVIVATLISLLGIVGPNVYSQIGNTAYVSGYLIFNFFFCLLLFVRSRNKWIRWVYLVPIIIMFWEFKAAHTSGAIIGLFLSFLLLIFLLGLFHKNRKIRRGALVALTITVIGVIIIFSQSQKIWFQTSFLKNLTPQKNTFQTRLISWRGAAQDFRYHPVLGTGFSNYAIIFDKHFDSKFFDYTKSETYFDRAHNNLIDIVSTTGLVGLLTYLSIFVIVLYYLGQRFKMNGRRVGWAEEGGRKNLEIVIIFSLLSAYFIQNLAVFDSFITYVALMMTLGFINWLIYQPLTVNGEVTELLETTNNDLEPEKMSLIKTRAGELIILITILILVLLFTNRYNVRPWRMFHGTIYGYSQILNGDFISGINTYQAVLVGAPLERDSRVTLINLVSSNLSVLASLANPVVAREILDYAIDLAVQNVAYNPRDSLMQMQLAQVLNTAAQFNYQDAKKFDYYSIQAIEAMDKAIAASPGRAPLYFIKAQMLLIRGEEVEAIKDAEYAVSLNPRYAESSCRLAQFQLLLKNEEAIAVPLNNCADLGGAAEIGSEALLTKGISYFAEHNDYPRALKFAERLTQLYSNAPSVWLNLAKLYVITGEAEKAQVAAEQAFALDPNLGKDWAEFMNSIKSLASSSNQMK